MTEIRQRRVSLSLLLSLLLTGLLTGCGSIMSSAGAGPIEEDPGERTLPNSLSVDYPLDYCPRALWFIPGFTYTPTFLPHYRQRFRQTGGGCSG